MQSKEFIKVIITKNTNKGSRAPIRPFLQILDSDGNPQESSLSSQFIRKLLHR